jgi:hypothetical protein
MGGGLLLFWAVVLAAVAACALALIAGLVIVIYAGVRRSRRALLLGAFATVLSSCALAIPMHLWLDQFHQARLPPYLLACSLALGLATALALAIALLRTVRNGSKKPRAARVPPVAHL